jgi:hypothetical protein
LLAAIDFELTGRFLGEPGQRGGFLALAGLLVGFLFIRTSARINRAEVSWWPGSVQTSSGLHIHHLVWGIVTVMLAGFLVIAIEPTSPGRDILAVAFGLGCGLTLDEFALWLRLEDVYWANEGRSSVDAVIVATIIGAMVVTGAAPFEADNGGSIAAVTGVILLNLTFVFLAIAKGKRFMAVAGAFVPLVAIVASTRLARPGSPWARRRYRAGSAKADKAKLRDARVRAMQDRFFNLVAGAPSRDDPPPRAE